MGFKRRNELHFADAVRDLAALEDLLRENGVEPSGRILEARETAEWLLGEFNWSGSPPNADHRRELLFMLDQLHFARSVLPLRTHTAFPALREHLVMLGRAMDPSQNAPIVLADPHRQDSNKLFELLVATSGISFASNVRIELEGAQADSGSNPDIMFEFQSKAWGVACKVPTSLKPRTYLNNVRGAVEQINRARLTRGVVMLNMRHVFPHDELMPFPYEKRSAAARDKTLNAFHGVLKRKVEQGARGLRQVGKSSKARVFLCHYIQTVYLGDESRMTPCVKLFFNAVPGWQTPRSGERALLDALNQALRW